VKDENVDRLADSQNILYRFKNHFCYLMYMQFMMLGWE